ncbi:unnamed protein product [Amoebophrya sp. A25]|nr:unnamed protein product [Amoebophrya sp. A25]|eukprot:GSA25T00019092001.1
MGVLARAKGKTVAKQVRKQEQRDVCVLCGDRVKDLDAHMKQSHGFVCPFCKKRHGNKLAWANHIRDIHGTSTKDAEKLQAGGGLFCTSISMSASSRGGLGLGCVDKNAGSSTSFRSTTCAVSSTALSAGSFGTILSTSASSAGASAKRGKRQLRRTNKVYGVVSSSSCTSSNVLGESSFFGSTSSFSKILGGQGQPGAGGVATSSSAPPSACTSPKNFSNLSHFDHQNRNKTLAPHLSASLATTTSHASKNATNTSSNKNKALLARSKTSGSVFTRFANAGSSDDEDADVGDIDTTALLDDGFSSRSSAGFQHLQSASSNRSVSAASSSSTAASSSSTSDTSSTTAASSTSSVLQLGACSATLQRSATMHSYMSAPHQPREFNAFKSVVVNSSTANMVPQPGMRHLEEGDFFASAMANSNSMSMSGATSMMNSIIGTTGGIFQHSTTSMSGTSALHQHNSSPALFGYPQGSSTSLRFNMDEHATSFGRAEFGSYATGAPMIPDIEDDDL